MSDIAVKICGLRDARTIHAAAEAGARYVGFNFFAKSKRSVTFEEAAALAPEVPVGIAKVGLVVDVDDTFLTQLLEAVPLDMIQLHGEESPERVAEVRARFGLPVIKAIGIAGPEDVPQIDAYSAVADMLLIDAKAPAGADLPGGNGLPFDWQLLANRKYWTKPWMLAGGLTAQNVAEAIRRTGARAVDVASGVESAPGVKDADMIAAFCAAARI